MPTAFYRLARRMLAVSLVLLLLFPAFKVPSLTPTAHAAIGKDPLYGKVPGLSEYSRVMIWYGTNTATQTQLDSLKTYDLVILEPTIRIINVANNQFYFETFTPNQVNEVKRGVDGILGTTDDVIVLAYMSVGELATSSVFTGFTGDMTIQNGKDVGLLPANYSGPSGPLHGPNPWNYNSSGSYINVEGGATPDGTANSGYNSYTGISIANDYSSTGNLLSWSNNGLMPWYLDQQGTWINDTRYMYGGYWKNGDGVPDKNKTYGGGYINGGDPTWKKLITFMTDKLEHDAGYDGVFLDTVDTPDPIGGAGPTTSWGPRGNFGFTAKGMVELVEAVKAVDPTKIVAANRGYWYFNPDEGTSQFAERYRHAINIFLTESWYFNPYITSGSKFYDENPAFADNWNTNPASPTYRSRDNFGGFWKDYMNAQANQSDGFNIIICDFTIPSTSTNKWMNEIVSNSHYMGYDVSGATAFSTMYHDAKNWLDASGQPSSSLTGMHPTDLYGGFNIDGQFNDWASETPIYSDPAGSNAKGITKVYTKFAGDKFLMKIDSLSALNMQGEMLYFDYDKKGTTGWQGVSWPITPDSRIYFENMNKVYLAPHVSGQGDVFKFPTTTVGNNGWPVIAKQSGNSVELMFDSDYIFGGALAGQEIWMWFRTANFGGQSIKFTVPGAPAVPSTPSGLTASPGNGQALLSWGPNSETNLAGYNVYRGGTKINSSLVTSPSYTATGLTNGTSYSFQVAAVNTSGVQSSLSTAVSVTPAAPVAPPAPTGLTATAGSGQAALNWTASTGANISGYNVYRNGVKVNGALITGTSYTNTGLTNGTAYSFQVSAVNSAGLESSLSSSVSVTPTGTSTTVITIDGSASDWNGVTALATSTSDVQALKAANTTSQLYLLVQGNNLNVKGQLFLDTDNNRLTGYNAAGWTASGVESGAEYMIENNIVYHNTGAGWSWTNVRTLSTSEFQRNNNVVELSIPLSTLSLTNGSTIRAGYISNDSTVNRLPGSGGILPSYTLGSSGTGGGGTTPDTTPPAVPTGLTASAGSSQVTLSWSANTDSDLQGYNLYRGTTKLNTTLISGTTYTATGLTNGTSYSFQVSAVDTSSNESAKTTAVNATPQASTTITIDGSASDWGAVSALNSSAGGTITAMKAKNDSTNLYLLIQGSGLNTKSQFYLNTDNNTSTGYNPANWAAGGVDTMLENQNLFAYSGINNGWTWSLASTITTAQFIRNDTVIELAIPLSSLGLSSGSTIRLGFITNDSTANRLPAANGSLLSFTLS
ncbi:fibronectin type III domain-containing protein [Paenibacillus lupini]|uniref:fibronectin type III domain-containing protein n=1 Tax=Paenibacillus lupini TaxID=1450204 RepID=UPI00141E9AE3|nr:fibronectin type III domain-containing protein [Paenibacillus lupini]NIK23590.1 fibronectin type 3 domain-containing protein [Paenibacillus lupini]